MENFIFSSILFYVSLLYTLYIRSCSTNDLFFCVGTMNCNSFRLLACCWFSLSFPFLHVKICFFSLYFEVFFSFCFVFFYAFVFFNSFVGLQFLLSFFIRFCVVPCSLQLVRFLAETRYTKTHYIDSQKKKNAFRL